MLSEELQIYKDTDIFVKTLSDVIQYGISKSWRQIAGVDMFRSAINLYKYIRLANSEPQNRIEHLEKYINILDTIKVYLRLSVETKNISLTKSAELILLLDGIGKQATGWKNSSANNDNTTGSDGAKASTGE